MGQTRITAAIFALLTWTAAAAQVLSVTSDTTLASVDTFEYIHVTSGARLTIADGAQITLTGKDASSRSIWVSGAGTQLRFGTPSNNLDPGDTAWIHLTDSSRVMVMGGAAIGSWGPDTSVLKPYTRLSSDIAIGDTVFTVDNHLGWRVGDRIAMSTSTIGPWETEDRVIERISGDTIEVTDGFWYQHIGTDSVTLRRLDTGGNVDATKVVDVRAYVANLTRPARMFTTGEADSTYGADIMIMSGSHAYFIGMQFDRLGMATPSVVPYNNGPTTWSYSGKQQPGRYTLHWHFTGDTDGDYVYNSTTYRTRHKSFNVHRAGNITLRHNVTYRGFGHQIVLGEDGDTSEVNLVCNYNLVMFSRRVINSSEPNDMPPGNDAAFGNTNGRTANNRIPGISYYAETHPGAFMMWTPSVTMVGNVAAGGLGSVGYYFQSYMGRGIGEGTADTATLPGDFTFANQIDSNLIALDTPTFVGNTAFGFLPEQNGPYGFIGDVGQGGFSLNTNAFLSYRKSGIAFWQSHGTSHQDRDLVEWNIRDLVVYNSAAVGWNEDWSINFQDLWGFHLQQGAVMLGGKMQRAFLSDSNYMGTECRTTLPWSTALAEGAITGTEDHYQGFTGPATMFVREYEGQGYPGISVYNKDQSGGARPARRPITLHRVHIEDYPVGLSVNGNFEGPVYLSQFYTPDATDRTVVDWRFDPTGGVAAGWWAWNGAPGQAAAKLTDTTRTALGAWDGIVFDIDSNRMYWANGRTVDTCGGWVVLRVDGVNEQSSIFSSSFQAPSPDPWYTTWSAFLPNPAYTVNPGSATDRQLHSATAIVPVGDSISGPENAWNVRAYGCRDGETVYVDSTAVTYTAESNSNLLNVNWMRQEAPEPTTVDLLPGGQTPPRLRLQNPRGRAINISLSGASDSIEPRIFGVNVQAMFEGDRRIAGLDFSDLQPLVDASPIYGSRLGGKRAWATYPDFADGVKGYGYIQTLGPNGDAIVSANRTISDTSFDYNVNRMWRDVISDTIPQLGVGGVTWTPHPYVDSTTIGLAVDTFLANGIGLDFLEPVNEVYGSPERGLVPYRRWHLWVVDTLQPIAAARGIDGVCGHLPPPDWFVLDSSKWKLGTYLRSTWADSARAAYTGTLNGYAQFKPTCSVAHPYREYIEDCFPTIDGRQRVDCNCLDRGFTRRSYYQQLTYRVRANADVFSDGTDTAGLIFTEHNRASQSEGLTGSWFDGAHAVESFLAMMRINAEYNGVIKAAHWQLFASQRGPGAFWSGLISMGYKGGPIKIQPSAGLVAMTEVFGGCDTAGAYLPLSSHNFGGYTDSLVLGMMSVNGAQRLAFVNYSARPLAVNVRGEGVAFVRYGDGFSGSSYLRQENKICLDMEPRRRKIQSVNNRTVIPPKSYGVLRNAVVSP